MKKIFLLGITTIYAISCANYRPESFEDKMGRFSAKDSNPNIVPHLTLPFNAQKTRQPASVQNQTNKKKNVSTDGEFSNKKLYFLELFNQYYQMAGMTPSTMPEIKSCPHFHSGILEQFGTYPVVKKDLGILSKNELSKPENQQVRDFLAQLPVHSDGPQPTVSEELKKNPKADSYTTQVKAIDVHVTKLHNEISELCQSGTSDNYYIFENLVTYIQSNKIEATEKGLAILLRTTVFSNSIILGQFKKVAEKGSSRMPASSITNRYTPQVLKRLDSEWAINFLE